MRAAYAFGIVVKNIIANLLRSWRPEPWIDRPGRVKGNMIALFDLLRAEGAWLSSTIRSFSTVDHRRRRSGHDRTETLLTFAHLLANQSASYRRQGSRPEGGPRRTVTVDPLAYLNDVLTGIVDGHPNSEIDQLPPWAYRHQDLKAVA
jgi:hypothetical protein